QLRDAGPSGVGAAATAQQAGGGDSQSAQDVAAGDRFVMHVRSSFERAGLKPCLYKFPFLASSRRYSDARQESAMMVSVGFLSGLVTSDAPSVTNKFFTSCAWQKPLSTDVFGSAPMRAVPTS